MSDSSPQTNARSLILDEALENLDVFARASYVGRKIVAGLSEDGKSIVFVYVLTSRSAPNKNRKLVQEGLRLPTAVADLAKQGGDAFTVYDVMNAVGGCHVVSNGDQTNNVIDTFTNMGKVSTATFMRSLSGRKYEGDGLKTPRITVMCLLGSIPRIEMAVLRRSRLGGDGCDRLHQVFEEFLPGLGWSIQTYENNDGDPVMFRGQAEVMPLPGDAQNILNVYHEATNPAVRVSVAVRMIPLDGGTPKTLVKNDFE